MTRRLGVVGYPLAHTLSPAIHKSALAQLGFEATYEACETAPPALGSLLADLRRPEWLGLNVTLPYKQLVMPELDDLTAEAREIGAVNTIHHTAGRLRGANMDARAFLADVEAAFGSLAGRRVAVLGAGGAALAVCHALRRGPEVVWLWARRAEQAAALAAHTGGAVRAAELPRVARAEMVINCTSAGLHQGESPVPAEALPPGVLLYDLIYNPATTRLMEAAQAQGGRAVNGLGMLVRQAALALEMWTGRMPALEEMFAAAERELARRTSAEMPARAGARQE
ncbi:MAG TPA: shikimate dehydrogenase [Chloroflexota bacterium]|nr:shikimate dehydrogenase [Chloroflexota bacterium]